MIAVSRPEGFGGMSVLHLIRTVAGATVSAFVVAAAIASCASVGEEFRTLDDRAITRLLVGHALVTPPIDASGSPDAIILPFERVEAFCPSGLWKNYGHRVSGGGRYEIRGEQVCVEYSSGGYCRSLLVDQAGNYYTLWAGSEQARREPVFIREPDPNAC